MLKGSPLTLQGLVIRYLNLQDKHTDSRSICLRVSIAVKRHHYHNSSYKGEHFIGAGLQLQHFQRICPIPLWSYAGKHGASEGAEHPTS